MAQFQPVRMILPVVFLLCGLLLVGCSSNVETFNSTTTIGQQLEDLDKAYKSNAITEAEYKKAKEILLEHYK